MANWEDISRNAKTRGDFAGRTQAEQDAYFIFFAGPKPHKQGAIRLKVRKLFASAQNWRAARSLRWPIVGVLSSKSSTRT